MPTTPFNTYLLDRLNPAINAEEAMKSIVHVNFAPNLNLPKGTVLGKITATGKYAAYNPVGADGTQTALPLITQYAVVTDADGMITNVGDFTATKHPSGPCFTQGYFYSEDLDNLDADGLADIGGKIVTGTLVAGLITF